MVKTSYFKILNHLKEFNFLNFLFKVTFDFDDYFIFENNSKIKHINIISNTSLKLANRNQELNIFLIMKIKEEMFFSKEIEYLRLFKQIETCLNHSNYFIENHEYFKLVGDDNKVNFVSGILFLEDLQFNCMNIKEKNTIFYQIVLLNKNEYNILQTLPRNKINLFVKDLKATNNRLLIAG